MVTIVRVKNPFMKKMQLIKASLKKWIQTDKEFSKNSYHRVISQMTQTAATGSKLIKKYFVLIFTTICHIPEWNLLIFSNALFFKFF